MCDIPHDRNLAKDEQLPTNISKKTSGRSPHPPEHSEQSAEIGPTIQAGQNFALATGKSWFVTLRLPPPRNYLNFFASSRNFANPISVKGCFNNPRIDSKGEVTTSAPTSAHFTICSELR